MKKSLLLLVVAVGVMCLSACGEKTQAEKDSTTLDVASDIIRCSLAYNADGKNLLSNQAIIACSREASDASNLTMDDARQFCGVAFQKAIMERETWSPSQQRSFADSICYTNAMVSLIQTLNRMIAMESEERQSQ
jgi:hypothetical protein